MEESVGELGAGAGGANAWAMGGASRNGCSVGAYTTFGFIFLVRARALHHRPPPPRHGLGQKLNGKVFHTICKCPLCACHWDDEESGTVGSIKWLFTWHSVGWARALGSTMLLYHRHYWHGINVIDIVP